MDITILALTILITLILTINRRICLLVHALNEET